MELFQIATFLVLLLLRHKIYTRPGFGVVPLGKRFFASKASLSVYIACRSGKSNVFPGIVLSFTRNMIIWLGRKGDFKAIMASAPRFFMSRSFNYVRDYLLLSYHAHNSDCNKF